MVEMRFAVKTLERKLDGRLVMNEHLKGIARLDSGQ